MRHFDIISSKICKMIQRHRELKGYTQLEISRMLGYPNSQFISNIEREMSKVPYEILGQLIVILDLPEREVVDILRENFTQHLSTDLSTGKEKAKIYKKKKPTKAS